MIQHYSELKSTIQSFQKEIVPNGVIQKIYSTSRYISMAIRSPGKTRHFFLGRGSGFEGAWLHHSPPTSSLRVRDVFLEYLRKHLSSSKILDISLDRSDRIIQLDYLKYGKKHSFLFFWKARHLYFLNVYYVNHQKYLFTSWMGKKEGHESQDEYFEIFNAVGRKSLENQMPLSRPRDMMEQLLQDESVKLENAILNRTKKKEKNFLSRKRKRIEADLKRIQSKHILLDFVEKNEDDQRMILKDLRVKLGPFEFKFSTQLNFHQKMNLIYQKIKSLRKGELILQDRLEKLLVKMNTSENEKNNQSIKLKNTLNIISPVWKSGQSMNEKDVMGDNRDSSNYPSNSLHSHESFKVFQFKECKIAIGLNASGNDEIRKSWASKDDTWMHLDEFKSAHAIVKLNSPLHLNQEILDYAASIIADYSQFKGDMIPVVYTFVKYIKGVKGTSGKVIFKKEKRRLCRRINYL